MSVPGGRRGTGVPEATALPEASQPRRGLIDQVAAPPTSEESAARRGPLLVIALGIAIAMAVGALWLVFGVREDSTTTSPEPSTASSATAVDPGTPLPSGDATAATSPAESGAPTITEPPPPHVATPEATPTPAPSPGVVVLDEGVILTMPPGWELYADEVVQNGRRLVRLRELTTDVRIQAVSLTSVTGPLDQACLDLVADHSGLYSGVAEGLPVSVGISGEGAGVSCAFTGTRISDGVPASVEFTLLKRGEATLVFRDTIPDALPEDAAALRELVTMECAAAQGFGVTVDQCLVTPAQADG